MPDNSKESGMRRFRSGIAATAVTVLALTLGACRPQGESAGGVGSGTTASPTSTTVKVAVATDFDPARFSDPTTIDNQWFPLKPGTQWSYEGSAIVDGKPERHRVVFTVTDLTKVVHGVRNLIVWDRDYSQGQLVEAELALFAQDDDGNVWHLGQYPEEYEDGKLVGTPAWFAGMEGGKPGISMRAAPRLGTSDYSQGLGPAVDWRDRAKTHQVGQQTCVPAGCYQNVLVMEEWDEADPAARQLKYYASGVGNVRVGWTGRDEEKEVLGLSKVVQLSPSALAEARNDALKLERSAYKVSKDLYGRTPPAEQLTG
jgi:hypothetical protein